MTDSKYTTIAVTPPDVDRLNDVKHKHLDNENASYRAIINYLIDEKEAREDTFEEVLAVALSKVDEDDVERVLQRTKNDAEWVATLNTGDEE